MNNFFEDEEVSIKNILVIDMMNLVFRTVNSSFRNNPLDLEFHEWKSNMFITLFSYIKLFKPERVVIALDSSNTWRKEIYPDYKGKRKDNRDSSPIDYDKFFSVYRDFENSLRNTFKNFLFIKSEAAEADDIVAVIAKKYNKTYTKVICVSNDGDLKQLVKYKNYSQYDPIKKKMVEIYDPEHYLISKILFGDSSDNIPHVENGKGQVKCEKNAKRLSEYLAESNNEVRQRFQLNKSLIDMDLIPERICKDILDKYDNYNIEKIESCSIYDFFVKERLGNLIEDSQKYLFLIKDLK